MKGLSYSINRMEVVDCWETVGLKIFELKASQHLGPLNDQGYSLLV